MKKFFKEFKDFISKGNVMSMAVGIIIGGAFTAVVNGIVTNLITPLLGLACGGIDFSDFEFNVRGSVFKIGLVINSVLTFLITAFVLFLIIKSFNGIESKIKKQIHSPQSDAKPEPEPVDANPSAQEALLTEIRDILKDGNTIGHYAGISIDEMKDMMRELTETKEQ